MHICSREEALLLLGFPPEGLTYASRQKKGRRRRDVAATAGATTTDGAADKAAAKAGKGGRKKGKQPKAKSKAEGATSAATAKPAAQEGGAAAWVQEAIVQTSVEVSVEPCDVTMLTPHHHNVYALVRRVCGVCHSALQSHERWHSCVVTRRRWLAPCRPTWTSCCLVVSLRRWCAVAHCFWTAALTLVSSRRWATRCSIAPRVCCGRLAAVPRVSRMRGCKPPLSMRSQHHKRACVCVCTWPFRRGELVW